MAQQGGPNREQLLRMAIQSAKQGNKDGARVMLRQILDEDQTNERAMLWMAKTSKSVSERRNWLENVLKVNPESEVAQRALDQMDYQENASETRKLFIFGGVAIGVIMLITIIIAAFWAFAPLTA